MIRWVAMVAALMLAPAALPAVAQADPASASPSPLPITFVPPPGWLEVRTALATATTVLGTWVPGDPAQAKSGTITLFSTPYSGTVLELVRDNLHKFSDPAIGVRAAFTLAGPPRRVLRCETTTAMMLDLVSAGPKHPERQLQSYIVTAGSAYVASYTYPAGAEDPGVTVAATLALHSLCPVDRPHPPMEQGKRSGGAGP